MFKQVMNFGMLRTSKQAIGFYIVHLIAACVLSGVAGGFVGGGTQGHEGFSIGARAGAVTAIFYCTFLSYSVLKQKNLLAKKANWGWVLASLVCSAIFGGLLGLVPIAYLTTKKNPSEGV